MKKKLLTSIPVVQSQKLRNYIVSNLSNNARSRTRILKGT